MRILDLFCGAGGAGMGYHLAGFEVVGVDIKPQKNYPFPFILGDALDVLARLITGEGIEASDGRAYYLHHFSAVHASPPCQGYSRLRHLPWLKDRKWPMLIDPCRELLRQTYKSWVIENVEDAPLAGIILCGTMFGLPCYRHRKFESNVLLMQYPHEPHKRTIGAGRLINDRRKGTLNAGSGKGTGGIGEMVTVAGGQFRKAQGEAALDINWMTCDELAQAIPPAYTKFIGEQLLYELARVA